LPHDAALLGMMVVGLVFLVDRAAAPIAPENCEVSTV
jgi:hypothetical protein